MPHDRLIKNVRLVRPGRPEAEAVDIAISGGRFAAIAPGIEASEANVVDDGRGLLAFPGLVDAHMHVGIYQELSKDAATESRAAAMGGVTSSINYMRTGQYYLNQVAAPTASSSPRCSQRSDGNFHVDYAYHLAPISSEPHRRVGDAVR